jgi:hypothetical protein
MMKRLAFSLVGATIALLGTTGSLAATVKQQPMHAVRMGTTTFRLAVAGSPAKGATFWVSYGPLAGKFGVIELRSTGSHLYSARTVLPVNEAGTFTYLKAQGVQKVHGSAQPGGIPVVIRSVAAVTAVEAASHIVHWSVPLG